MSMLTELFGEDVVILSLAEVKEKIKSLPAERQERKSYLLREFAAITGIILTREDYSEIGA